MPLTSYARAKALLLFRLGDGAPHQAADIVAEAEILGLTLHDLSRVAHRIHVEAIDYRAGWRNTYWQLPWIAEGMTMQDWWACQVERAKAFLSAQLAQGPREATEMFHEATAQGISDSALCVALDTVGILREKRSIPEDDPELIAAGFRQRWQITWRLPE